jgi:3-deoxy-D-manno-octulosonic-acid transferase
MLFLYNIVWFLFLPVVLAIFACRAKYRRRLPARFGWGLRRRWAEKRTGHPTVWVHALSVGEVTSAAPLVRALRSHYPQAYLVVSVTTATGRVVADRHLRGVVDQVIDGPIDLLPVVNHFINTIAPDFYILVETDFWPNLLNALKRRGIPALLVNGRISATSMRRYQRGKTFFLPMFQCFSALAMQTGADRDKLYDLGLEKHLLPILGNLKFATILHAQTTDTQIGNMLPRERSLFVAGSTHGGEELLLLDVYRQLRSSYPELYLVIVPRDPLRAPEIAIMARERGFAARLRSSAEPAPGDLTIVDTIGELLALYSVACLAFVGGSLVAKGGHNPLEPAGLGVPVLFGPHMEDFSEIATLLVAGGAARMISNGDDLYHAVATLLADIKLRLSMGEKARQTVMAHSNVIDNHLHLIRTLL